MLDVFIIQSVFIVIFRYVFGIDIPNYAVFACLFGTGAVQRLKDNWRILSDLTGTTDIEPSLWHSPIFQALSWPFFWFSTVWVLLVWGGVPVPTVTPVSPVPEQVGFWKAFFYVADAYPVLNWIGFYLWGLMTSIVFDAVAFKSKLLYPISDRVAGFDLVGTFDSKGGGWFMSILITAFAGFLLSILILDAFWSNVVF